MSSIDFTSFLKLMAHQKASDLFITAGMPPSMKVNGKISPITQNPLTPQQSRDLVVNVMTPPQREEFERRNCLTVTVPGRGRFAILPRRTLNVLNLDSGECYCCITESDVPLSDLMLAQKLLLEHDPDRFFAVANCPSEFLFGAVTSGTPGRRPRRVGGVLSRMRW